MCSYCYETTKDAQNNKNNFLMTAHAQNIPVTKKDGCNKQTGFYLFIFLTKQNHKT